MAAGDPWLLPSGRKGIEMPGSTRDVLRLATVVDGWPWPAPPISVVRSLCTPVVARYLTPEGRVGA